MSDILYCTRCEDKIEAYSDGSNIEDIVDWFFKHKLHMLDIKRIKYP